MAKTNHPDQPVLFEGMQYRRAKSKRPRNCRRVMGGTVQPGDFVKVGAAWAKADALRFGTRIIGTPTALWECVLSPMDT